MRSLVIIIAVAALSSAACATSGAVPRAFPGATGATGAGTACNAPSAPRAPSAPAAPVAPDASASAPSELEELRRDKPGLLSPRFDGRAIAQFALGFRGVPYRLGGADPGGFDCSGLVQYVFAQYGSPFRGSSNSSTRVGDKIRPSDIEPGDLIFFNTKTRGRGASHVAIAIGRTASSTRRIRPASSGSKR